MILKTDCWGYVMGERRAFSLDTKANNATKVQNDTILTKMWPSLERKGKWWMFEGGKEGADCFSQSRLLSISWSLCDWLWATALSSPKQHTSSCPCPVYLDLLRQKTPSLIGSCANVGVSGWSSWVAIGQWRPAGSWRRLRGRELPLASVSCSPFVNCPEHRKHVMWPLHLKIKHDAPVKHIYSVFVPT